MNTEQRIEQIREQQIKHSALFDASDSHKIVQRSEIRKMLNSIDILLSLVSQEAGPSPWLPIEIAPKSDTIWLVVAKIADSEPNKGAVLWWYRAMFWRGAWRTSRDYSGSVEPTHFFNPEQVTDAAASMRSACVEKVKSLIEEWGDPNSDLGDEVSGFRIDAANEIITALESVSIQEQKK